MILRFFVLPLILLSIIGCTPRQDPPPVQPTSATTTSPTAAQSFAAKEAEDRTAAAAAAAKGDKLKALEAERDATMAESAKYKALAQEADSQVKLLNSAITDERNRQWTVRLWVAAGSFLAAAALAFGLGLYFKISWLLHVGTGGVAMSALCFLASWLVPYFLWISLAIVLGLIGWLIVALRRHSITLTQVTQAVEAAKTTEGEIKLDDYKAHFRQFIDEASDKLLNKIRDV
jgi:hypothetical protein